MGQIEIKDKLDSLLLHHLPFTEEFHVVYLLVETRKMLDRDNSRKYPILRFYCNWCVHTDKDSTAEMESIMKGIYRDIVTEIQNPALKNGKVKIIGFMYMEDLQVEMENFLKEYQLPNPLVSKENWLALVSLLVKILADQPINNPCPEIKSFSFLPAAEGCVLGRVDFTDKVGQYTHYSFGNAY